MKTITRFAKLTATVIACLSLAGCDDVSVYGSVGYRNYGGYPGGGRDGTGVRVGGRNY